MLKSKAVCNALNFSVSMKLSSAPFYEFLTKEILLNENA
jgi:hypothetical protein